MLLQLSSSPAPNLFSLPSPLLPCSLQSVGFPGIDSCFDKKKNAPTFFHLSRLFTMLFMLVPSGGRTMLVPYNPAYAPIMDSMKGYAPETVRRVFLKVGRCTRFLQTHSSFARSLARSLACTQPTMPLQSHTTTASSVLAITTRTKWSPTRLSWIPLRFNLMWTCVCSAYVCVGVCAFMFVYVSAHVCICLCISSTASSTSGCI